MTNTPATYLTRLALALCLLLVSLTAKADDLSGLTAIDTYKLITASDMGTTGSTLVGNNYFFNLGSTKTSTYSWPPASNPEYNNLKNGTLLNSDTSQKITGLRVKDSGTTGIAFKLSENLKCKIFVYVQNGGSSGTRCIAFCKSASSISSLPSDAETIQIPSNSGAVINFEATGTASDYFFITGNGNDLYLMAIEIVPYIDSSQINYDDSYPPTVCLDFADTQTTALKIDSLEVKGAKYSGATEWISVHPQQGLTYTYGNQDEIWTGNQTIDWDNSGYITITRHMFADMSVGDKITLHFDTSYDNYTIKLYDGWWQSTFTTESGSGDTYTYTLTDNSIAKTDDSSVTHTALEWMQSQGLVISGVNCTVVKVSYEHASGNQDLYTVDENGNISILTTPFSAERTFVKATVSNSSSTSYTLVSGTDVYNSSGHEYVAYYFDNPELLIPVFVSSTWTPDVAPIRDYYNITADDMKPNTFDTYGDGHFYVVGGETMNVKYGGNITFANGESKTVTQGYDSKFAADGFAFKIMKGLKAQVRVYINGAVGRCVALRQGANISDANVVTYASGIGAGKITTLTADITGTESDFFFVTGYKDSTYSENDIYIVGLEVIPYLTGSWVYYGSNNTVSMTIDQDTETPYMSPYNPTNLTFGGALSNGTDALNTTNSDLNSVDDGELNSSGEKWIVLHCGSTSDYQLIYYYDDFDTSYFTIDENGQITLAQPAFTAYEPNADIHHNLYGVQAGYIESEVDGVTTTTPVAYYFSSITVGNDPVKLYVSASLADVLTVSLSGPCYNTNYTYTADNGVSETLPLYVYYDDPSTLPVPLVYYSANDVTSSSTIRTATATWLTNLETTDQEYNISVSTTSSNSTITLSDLKSATLDPANDIYANALFKVSIPVSYDSKEVTKEYYLAVMCPNYTFAKIGSDAKLITGSLSTGAYASSDADSTSPNWSGWSGDTHTLTNYTQLGAYYVSTDWPIVFSYSLTESGYKNFYRIDYRAYKASDRGNAANTATASSDGNGSTRNGTRISLDGSSSLYDGLKIEFIDDDVSEPRYLDVRVYAKGVSGNPVVFKGLYKFILYKAPTISTSESHNGDNYFYDITSDDVTISTTNSVTSSYYTNDGTMPTAIGSENLHEYSGAITPTQTTVYYAADFVTPAYYYYTGEMDASKNRLASNTLPVISKKYMKKIAKEEAYAVDSDSSLPAKDTFFAPFDIKIQASAAAGGQTSLRVKVGTQNVLIYRNSAFEVGGVQWEKGEDSGFDEYIDEYETPIMGSDWKPSKGTTIWGNNSSDEGEGDSATGNSYIANPYTECNGGIGGANTENGGMFLAPVSGDFFRMEPEYDGVITLWVRQNGASDNSSRITGYLARRPVYIMDEDGIIMPRSSIKPLVDSYYCVDGTYAVISGRNTFRRDFEETWRFGLLNWNNEAVKINSKGESQNSVLDTKDSYSLYSKWYSNIKFATSNGDVDFTKTDFVDRFDKMSSIIYRDEAMIAACEAGLSSVSFAKYGYELPNFSYVRYRIPVKAGKTYYLGGRGTKNGLVAVQFEGMPINYNPIQYYKNGNKLYSSVDADYSTEISDVTQLTRPTEAGEIGKSYSTSDSNPMYHMYEGGTYAYSEDGSTESTLSNLAALDSKITSGLSSHAGEPGYNKYTTINFTLHRTFTAGYWHPIVLPFSVNESRMREIFGDQVAVIYLDPNDNAMNGTTGSYTSVINPAVGSDMVLRFTRHYYQMLYANTPAFICPSKSVTDPTFYRVTYQGCSVKSYDIGHGYEVTGTYSTTTLGSSDDTDYGIYYLSNSGASDNVASIYHLAPGSTVTMKPTRVWIQKKAGSGTAAPARLLSVGFQSYEGGDLDSVEATSDIQDVISDELPAEYADDNVYDLMGRIVARGSTFGLRPGIYIHQGRKIHVTPNH